MPHDRGDNHECRFSEGLVVREGDGIPLGEQGDAPRSIAMSASALRPWALYMGSEGRQLDRSGYQVLLLRHGHVASHVGDVPLTREGHQQAHLAGQRLAQGGLSWLATLSSPTLRTRETAQEVFRAVRATRGDVPLAEPRVSFALRNPDLYLGGERVDMVSSVDAFLDQAPMVREHHFREVPFYTEFLEAPDRIGYWLHHPNPPGDSAATTAARVSAWVHSLGDIHAGNQRTVVAVTHSPVLRAVALAYLGEDPGEPDHLTGYVATVAPDGHLAVRSYRCGDPLPEA